MSSLFRVKKRTAKLEQDSRKTIDAEHTLMLHRFHTVRERLPELKSALNALKTQYDALKQLKHEKTEAGEKLTSEQMIALRNLKFDIRQKQREIIEIENGGSEVKYFLENSEYLHIYYTNKSGTSSPPTNTPIATPSMLQIKKPSAKQVSILDYLAPAAPETLAEECDNDTPAVNCSAHDVRGRTAPTHDVRGRTAPTPDVRDRTAPTRCAPTSVQEPVPEIKPTYTFRGIVDKYMSNIDQSYAFDDVMEETHDYCVRCGEDMTLIPSEGIIVCSSCGEQKQVLMEFEKASYKDPPREVAFYTYKRINHLNEILAQFQAKETTEISQLVFDEILNEIRKERITNMSSVTYRKLKDILQRLQYNNLYEHRAYILNRLNGIPPPIMSPELETKIRNMFQEIQIPFLNNCPSDRTNFLSYYYVLHKFCQLLGHDEFLPHFPLLKSREKLQLQDCLWNKICDEVGWEYIPSM